MFVYVTPANPFSLLLQWLNEHSRTGLYLEYERSLEGKNAAQVAWAFANTTAFSQVERTIKEIAFSIRQKVLPDRDVRELCQHKIEPQLRTLLGETRSTQSDTPTSTVITRFSDVIDMIYKEVESYRWSTDDVRPIQIVLRDKTAGKSWCDFFEDSNVWSPISSDTIQENQSQEQPVDEASITPSAGGTMEEIYISYAWGSESELIIDQLTRAFRNRALQLHRDRTDMKYKDSLREFMGRLGAGRCIVLIIGEAYLKSKNCMFELIQILDGGQIRDRVFPIVLRDANLYDAQGIVGYVKHWEMKKKSLESSLKEVGGENLGTIYEELDLYAEIRSVFNDIVGNLRDMNALSVEEHQNTSFEQLISQVEHRLMLK
jgi:hypothetical protein